MKIGDCWLPGLSSYADVSFLPDSFQSLLINKKTDWLVPLSACIELSNVGQETIYVASNLIFSVYTLNSRRSPILFPYHDATYDLVLSLYEAQLKSAALMDKYAILIRSGEPLDQQVRDEIRDIGACLRTAHVAIKASEDQILSSEASLIESLRSEYESHSIIPRFVPWLGTPSERTLMFESIPSKILDIVARLHTLDDCLKVYEAHLHHMNLQLLQPAAIHNMVAGRLNLLAELLRWNASPMAMPVFSLENSERMLGGISPSQWAVPSIWWVDGDIIRCLSQNRKYP